MDTIACPVDLRRYFRPGDTVMWPQGTAEPLTLTRRLVEQRHDLEDLRVFVASLLGDVVTRDNVDGMRLTAPGGLARAGQLTRGGSVEILPVRISSLGRFLGAGRLPIDVALVQVSGPDAFGRYSVGCTSDYVLAMIRSARIVVAEINDQAPFTFGDTLVEASDIDVVVSVSYPPIQVPEAPAAPGSASARIAERIAGLIPDGATLQLGIGATVDALPEYLAGKKDLGLHSGVIGDAALRLIQAGVVTNDCKEIDRGVTVTGALFGTDRLYAWADRNPMLAMRSTEYTHAPEVLARFSSLWAINSAVEIDLSGQINCEVAGGRYVGAIGGQLDFADIASRSRLGRSVLALTSTAVGGSVSRIVGRLGDGVTSVPRADADLVVTEHGVADLRGATLSERAERLIAIADPAQHDALRADLEARR
jgi:acyl-CoA hydrolase